MSPLTPLLDRLAPVDRAEPELVTLTLDVAQTGILPEETRLFLKDRALKSIAPDLADRIRDYVEGELAPGAHGLYLVAGPDLWEAVELQVPLPNLLHVGRAPYLPPLLAAIARAPRVRVARFDERRALLQSFELGVWSEAEQWSPFRFDRDPERVLTGRPVTSPFRYAGGRTGIGGGKRDRFEQTLEAETERMIEEVARRIAAEPPPAAILVFSDRERFGIFRNHLPAALRPAADPLGPAPREEPALRRAVAARVAERVAERDRQEMEQFEERRAQGHLVALGPDEVAAHRTTGRLARVFLDPREAVPGSRCLPCAALRSGPPDACPTCRAPTEPVSIAQEIVSHALAHPPLALTFVSDGRLRSHGGMAGLLSQKAVRGRRL